MASATAHQAIFELTTIVNLKWQKEAITAHLTLAKCVRKAANVLTAVVSAMPPTAAISKKLLYLLLASHAAKVKCVLAHQHALKAFASALLAFI
uniref:Uncharacterized protein n=1 Tax=Plectus sambesii TaxID=2011161 RepID=A0A914X364_9BILA